MNGAELAKARAYMVAKLWAQFALALLAAPFLAYWLAVLLSWVWAWVLPLEVAEGMGNVVSTLAALACVIAAFVRAAVESSM